MEAQRSNSTSYSSRRAVSAALLATALIAASCSGGDDSSTPSTTEPATATSTSTTAAATTTAPAPVTTDPTGDPRLDFSVPNPDSTPIPLDPAVRTGVLDNGLTYFVASNDSPGGKLELRLAVDVGSLQQAVPDAGSAHFLEHMLFNGTEQFPKLTLDDALRGFGMTIGPDINASTWFDETIYQLSLPTSDPAAVATAFDIVREWMSAAAIEPDDVIEERGVVREELRLRDESAGGVINKPILAAYLSNSPYSGREVSGTVEQAETTTADRLRALYEKWYRPDNMAVVAVGDIDVETLEELVRSEFSDLAPGAGDLDSVDRDLPDITEPIVGVVTHPEGPEPRISLDFPLPHWDPATVGGERLRLIEDLINDMLALHLDNAASRGTIDVAQPFGGTFEMVRQRRLFGFNFGGDDQILATEQVLAELNGLLVNGFDAALFDQIAAEYVAGLEQSVASVGSRQDATIAGSLVNHFLEGAEFDTVAATADRLLAVLDDLNVDDLTNHYRYVMSRSAPLVFAVGNDPADVDLEELEAAVASGIEADATSALAVSNVAPGQDLMERPEAIAAVSIESIDSQGVEATKITLANGVVVMFTDSDIAEAQVSLLALSEGGYSLLSADIAPLAVAAVEAAAASGVGDLDVVDLETALSGSVVSVTPFLTRLEEGFAASAGVDDVEAMFQLFHLFVTEPRIDDVAWRDALEQARRSENYYATDPQGTAFSALIDLRYGDNGYRDLYVPASVIEDTDSDVALDLYRQRFGQVDDLVVAIAGDIDLDTIVELAEAYLATLPPGTDDTWVDYTDTQPSGILSATVSAGEDAASAGFDLLFTLEGVPSEQDRAGALLLESILGHRFFSTIREELGASYNGGSAFISVSDPDQPGLELFVTVDGDPDRLDEVHDRVLAELADIASGGISSEEFDDAAAILINELNFVNNGDLIDDLLELSRNDEDAWTLFVRYFAVTDTSRSDVSSLAARLIDLDNRIEIFRADG